MVRRGFSKAFVPRGPAQIFKKRHTRFSISVANSTPTDLADIALRETGTIYSVKVGVAAFSSAAAAGEVMRCDLGIACTIAD